MIIAITLSGVAQEKQVIYQLWFWLPPSLSIYFYLSISVSLSLWLCQSLYYSPLSCWQWGLEERGWWSDVLYLAVGAHLMSELLFDQDIWCVYASISQQKNSSAQCWLRDWSWLVARHGSAWWDHTTLMALGRDFTNRQMGGNAFKIEFLRTTPTLQHH